MPVTGRVGSGVFARDPDALIDMIELEVTDAMHGNLCRAPGMRSHHRSTGQGKSLDGKRIVPEDDAIVADKLVKWAESAGFGDIIRAVRPGSSGKRQRGHRLEEFEGILARVQAIQRRKWFPHIRGHTIDENSILADAKQPESAAKANKDRR